ncbi:hypothetical protein O6H91_02G066600 [Diphasiastrum complanatum]|uniref:Uncharacterized protein n=1 Tax=Diphasiastrum complanatum TaxID=34168 RepID=A0ACC2EH14_DIPCM|nr:hypothetical protein O6H91_02G066600 [Diphasiastrum complanatum]
MTTEDDDSRIITVSADNSDNTQYLSRWAPASDAAAAAACDGWNGAHHRFELTDQASGRWCFYRVQGIRIHDPSHAHCPTFFGIYSIALLAAAVLLHCHMTPLKPYTQPLPVRADS